MAKGGNAVSIPVVTCSKQDINATVSHTENYNGLDWTVTKVTGSSGGFTSITIGAYTGPTPPLSAADGILSHFNIPCSNLAGSDISNFETVGGSSTYNIYSSGNPSFGDTYVAEGDGTVKTVDDAGRIVLPKEYRNKMNINSGTKVVLYENDGKLTMEVVTPKCKLCGTAEQVNEELSLCENCIKKVKEY